MDWLDLWVRLEVKETRAPLGHKAPMALTGGLDLLDHKVCLETLAGMEGQVVLVPVGFQVILE